jgi:hypothetical protein
MSITNNKRSPYTRDAPFFDDELTHWGILGQKWGERRFQNSDGSLTEEGRKRYGVGSARTGGFASRLKANHAAKVAQKKKEKAKKARLEKARKAREKAKKEKAKIPSKKQLEKILKSGSARQLDKYKEYFTTEQKKAAYDRLLAEKNIRSTRKSAVDTIGDISKGIGNVSSAIDNATKLYNNYARVANTFWDADLKYINTEMKNGSKKLGSNANRLAEYYIKSMSDKSAKEIAESGINFATVAANVRYLDEIEQKATGQKSKKENSPLDDVKDILRMKK